MAENKWGNWGFPTPPKIQWSFQPTYTGNCFFLGKPCTSG